MLIHDLHRQGWTCKEIAAETGLHPSTVSKHLKAGGPPTKRRVADEALVMNARWKRRVAELVGAYPRLLGVSVFNKIRAEGFPGAYPTVTRELRAIRGPRFRATEAVSVPIHTDPGEEAQFDFCNLSSWASRWGWATPLWCFGMILCWSRWRMWWFTTSEDRQHTFEGVARFFDAAGGVPAACRTDRMGALGRSQGRRFVLHPPTIGFAAHHATTITSCKARDAKRKGKVERPFRQLQETFLPEVEVDGVPHDLAELNHRAALWLEERVHRVRSRATGERPADRLVLERPFLTPLPRVRFDTDYVETRRVHAIVPHISVNGGLYGVPAEVRGQLVEIRRPVDGTRFTVRWAGRDVVTHDLQPAPGRDIVWLAEHRGELEALALAGGSQPERHLHLVPPRPWEQLQLGEGDYDVETPDLDARYGAGGDLR
ncbi:MAG TPA: IS21 family transposase [Acidimicrobiales bacterium]|nr:IS21 family transposase [Acidimicrobiales bacterium]